MQLLLLPLVTLSRFANLFLDHSSLQLVCLVLASILFLLLVLVFVEEPNGNLEVTS